MRAANIFIIAIVVIVSSSLSAAENVGELKAKWEGVNTQINDINAEQANEVAQPADSSKPVTPVDPNSIPLSATLVAWISSQCEGIVEELEAIARQNAEFLGFSVVNYLRYLHLYDDLKVISAVNVPQLRWVKRKAGVFETIYSSANEMVSNYLRILDESLLKIENAERLGKRQSVNKEWLNLYESIRYISTHAPTGSQLAKDATELLMKSPNNTLEKVRRTRFDLATKAFSR